NDLDVGTGRKEVRSECSHAFDQMLAVIQHKQHPFVANTFRELFFSGQVSSLYETQRLKDSARDQIWILRRKGSQGDEERTILKLREHAARRLDAQPRFANATRASQCDQAILCKKIDHFMLFFFAPDKTGHLNRQVVTMRKRIERWKLRRQIRNIQLKEM